MCACVRAYVCVLVCLCVCVCANRFLTKSIKNQHGAAHAESETPRRRGLLESLFGIRPADPGNGVEGSRVIHPYSPFYTGALSLFFAYDYK
jgi:hypothetical protein